MTSVYSILDFTGNCFSSNILFSKVITMYKVLQLLIKNGKPSITNNMRISYFRTNTWMLKLKDLCFTFGLEVLATQ